MYDVVSVRVQAGKGGDGAVSFRHEKYVPYGGPDGGDGGMGGNVLIAADPSVTSLKTFRNRGLYKAFDGDSGKGQKKYGKNGEDLVIGVPVGTTVYEETDGEKTVLADLAEPGEKVVVAMGGKGGWGNVHYASSTNQTPRLAQVGVDGELKSLVLELRLIADVGIIGFPNVGKSSLLAAASRATPRIANFPFTTKEPELGVVEVGNEAFVLAEIPGLIEGASQGRGLGHDFLRHSTRTRVFIHLVDGGSPSPAEDMVKVNNELHLYDPALAEKPQVVVVNKVDLPEVRERMPHIRDEFSAAGVTVRFISAQTGEGVREVMKAAFAVSQSLRVQGPPGEIKVFRPEPRHPRITVEKQGDKFVIKGPDIERIVARVDLSDPTVMRQIRAFVTRRGVAQDLVKAGIKGGDKVRCGDAEWFW